MSAQGILADCAIRDALQRGEIQIDPYNPEHLNPASYDLTLGEEVTVYKDWVSYDGLSRADICGRPRDGSDVHLFNSNPHYFDIKNKPEVISFKMTKEHGWLLKPGIGYLMHTHERVWTERYVPVLDGKSSIGRLFIQVHATAGYGDPGFDGQYTLEVISTHCIRIYPGMRIAQIRFHTLVTNSPTLSTSEKTYNVTGHYNGENAKGAVASQAYRQFLK